MEMGYSPSYFFDEMTFLELAIICDNLQYRYRDSWEQTRLLAYIQAQSNSTKKLKPTDIVKFQWDEQGEKTQPSVITETDIQRLKEKAKAFEMKNKEENTHLTNG